MKPDDNGGWTRDTQANKITVGDYGSFLDNVRSYGSNHDYSGGDSVVSGGSGREVKRVQWVIIRWWEIETKLLVLRTYQRLSEELFMGLVKEVQELLRATDHLLHQFSCAE